MDVEEELGGEVNLLRVGETTCRDKAASSLAIK